MTEPFLQISLTNIFVVLLAVGNIIWILISTKQQSTQKDVLLTLQTEISALHLKNEQQTATLMQELGKLRLEQEKARREDENRMKEWINGSFLRAEEVRTEIRSLNDKIEATTSAVNRIEEEGCRNLALHLK